MAAASDDPIALVAGAVGSALGDLLTPPFRGVLLRSLGVTLAIVAALWALFTRLVAGWIGGLGATGSPDLPLWLDVAHWAAGLLSGAAILVGLAFLIAPITAALAGLFLDEVAAATERAHYPDDPPGRPLPWRQSLAETARFTALSLVVNLVCLVLLLVPGVNLVAFTLGNGWLIGREYFALAAGRLLDPAAAAELAARRRGVAFAAGILAAVVLSIPILNLVTPLFATATMVHLVKRATGGRPESTGDQARQ